jgi:peptidoglycan/xylan/chitin deacetylase (PgdA/CDA1 family)
LGGNTLLRGSRWRGNRLLILCYHGISLVDEHCWNPALYIPGDLLEQRLKAIREQGYNVLPLDEALCRLYAGELPPQSVCLTFDDGFHDFRAVAYPLLQRYGMPATVYLTSFYSEYRRPIFDLMCGYLLWKARDRSLDPALLRIGGDTVALAERGARKRLTCALRSHANKNGYSADQRDQLLRRLAAQLCLDYKALVASRILQIMSATELAELDPRLVQVELHTHRHRVPLDEALFRREIRQNRDYIRDAVRGRDPRHFCYPSGVTSPAFLPWLRELGVRSATTCRPGLASPADDPLMLPRFLDMCGVSPDEFDSWLTGLASKLPRRRLTDPEPTASGILV